MPDFSGTKVSTAGLGVETGTATSVVSAGTCTVTIGDTTVTVNAVRGLTVAVGDVLLIAKQKSARWAIARLYTAAPPAPSVPADPAPAPKPTTVTGQLVCGPTYTGSFRDGKWRTDDPDVFQGKHASSSFGISTGAAFYGSKPRSLGGANVTRARIRLRRLSGGNFGAESASLWLVTEATKPSGAPTRTTTTGVTAMRVNTDLIFTIPDSWGQAIVDGASGGLAVHVAGSTPYIQFAGRASWSAAWSLIIDWSRTE